MADKVEEFIKNHPAATRAMLGMANVLLSKPGMSEDEVRHNLLLAASSGKVVTGAKAVSQERKSSSSNLKNTGLSAMGDYLEITKDVENIDIQIKNTLRDLKNASGEKKAILMIKLQRLRSERQRLYKKQCILFATLQTSEKAYVPQCKGESLYDDPYLTQKERYPLMLPIVRELKRMVRDDSALQKLSGLSKTEIDKVEDEFLCALFIKETNGVGFIQGKLSIRFEVAEFLKALNGERGDSHSNPKKLFKKASENTIKDIKYYFESISYDKEYISYTGQLKNNKINIHEIANPIEDLKLQYSVLDLALDRLKRTKADEQYAYLALGMGLAQMQGGYLDLSGYPTAKDMFDELSSGLENHMASVMHRFSQNKNELTKSQQKGKKSIERFQKFWNPGDSQYAAKLRDIYLDCIKGAYGK